MNAVTSVKASEALDNLIDTVLLDAEPTIICNNRGNNAVLMSLDEFNSWKETLYLLSNPVNSEHLERSIFQAKTGKIFEKSLLE